jgi:hypothetical protein
MKVWFVLCVLAGLAATAQLASAQSYNSVCEIEVTVKTHSGTPLKGAPLVVTRTGASAVESKAVTNSAGVARICDPPMDTPLDVYVGRGASCSVTINHVIPSWAMPRHFEVILDICTYNSLSKLCDYALRVRDEEGKSVSGVDLVVPANSEGVVRSQPRSDDLGRIFATVLNQRIIDVTLRKFGYEDNPTMLYCEEKTFAKEVFVTLKREKR